MRLQKVLGVTVVALAFVAALTARATAKDLYDVLVPYEASLTGSHIASGHYKIQWQTHSPEATVTLSKDRKVVATAEGKVVDRGKKYLSNEIVYEEKADGTRFIQEIRFKDSTQVIVFQE